MPELTYIARDLEPIVLQASQEYPVVLVTGQRQVGKTTMLRRLMKGTQRSYVTLDDLDARALASNDPEMFLQLHKPPVLIDEVQYAPELFSYIKLIADREQKTGLFWLTGSQPFRLMELTGESLAGRVAVLHLTTLSQKELFGDGKAEPFTIDIQSLNRRAKHRKPADTPSFFQRIFVGSMPAYASGRVSNQQLFYSSYIQTYVERDVRELSGSIDSTEFARFIRAVACRCAQIVNAADIGRDVDGMRSEKVKEWLGILERSGIIFYLYPYSNNLLKRTVKAPKLYFYDSGLVAYLTKWSSAETLEAGAMSGAILENYTVAEIVKSYLNIGIEPNLYYYRDKDTQEIDVVLESNGQLNPLEIKKTASPDSRLARTFKVLDKGAIPRGMGGILCMKAELSAIDSQNLIIPVWLI
ncbi:MAG TPA: ATP-binding protein [Alphaproteobacteria bacterium]|nr:ATP-binding protein [Alphaproteobacteria bacterium]